jgi:Uma2 family endonuclease
VNGPDLRVGHKDETGYNYPDVSVTCGTPEFREDDRELTLTNPTALFEVSSPPTAEYDRGEKVRRYTRLPSVRLYAMLDQERCAATVLRRGEDGSWSMTDIEGPDAAIEVDPPGVTLRLGEVYADLLKRQAASDD